MPKEGGIRRRERRSKAAYVCWDRDTDRYIMEQSTEPHADRQKYLVTS